ncbi:MAG: helix-turn-helix domain-containing protein [Nanoarchaeota archaeon]
MDVAPLKEAGLTEGEIKVYLALLELGSTTIGPVLEKSRITKSIIYRILDRLIEKGLVSYITKEKTKHYQAEQPNRLLDYIESREKRLAQNKMQVQDMLPELLLKQTLAKKSEANIFEGFKGLMTAYENRYLKLNAGDEVVLYGLPAEQPGFHHAFWKKNHMRLAASGIRCRMLYQQDVGDDILKNRNSYTGCQARRMPFDIASPSWVMVYKDVTLVAIPQGEKPFAFEITSLAIADSFKAYFEWFWTKST